VRLVGPRQEEARFYAIKGGETSLLSLPPRNTILLIGVMQSANREIGVPGSNDPGRAMFALVFLVALAGLARNEAFRAQERRLPLM